MVCLEEKYDYLVLVDIKVGGCCGYFVENVIKFRWGVLYFFWFFFYVD